MGCKNHLRLPAATECDRIVASLSGMDAVSSRSLLEFQWRSELAVELRARLSVALPKLSKLRAVQCTFFNKHAASNWFVAYHQDRSLPASPVVSQTWPNQTCKEGMPFVLGPVTVLEQMVALRLHLDGCSPANGPLRVLPGSHRFGTLSRERIEEIREQTVQYELFVERGSVIAMRPQLLHASSKSRTNRSRRVLHFLFGPAKLPEGLEWNRAV